MDSPHAIHGFYYGLINKSPSQDARDQMNLDAIPKEQEQKMFAVLSLIIPALTILAYIYYSILDMRERNYF